MVPSDEATERRHDEHSARTRRTPRISIIAAMAENRVIGVGNELPWRLPDEMKRFRELTTGHTVIMGRKTNDSIGRPLPKRRSIVISRQARRSTAGELAFAGSLDGALDGTRNESEVFIIGGAAIYRLALPLADRLYLTVVHAVIDGDVHFPEFDLDDWAVVEERHHPADERHAHAFTMFTYDRVEEVEVETRRATEGHGG